MLRTISTLRHQMVTKRKSSPKVADETMFTTTNNNNNNNLNMDGYGNNMPIYAAHNQSTTTTTTKAWNGLATIFRIPFSILSCFSHQHGNAADAIWVTGEMLRTSEIDHLMVSDSMRYAILM